MQKVKGVGMGSNKNGRLPRGTGEARGRSGEERRGVLGGLQQVHSLVQPRANSSGTFRQIMR